ncbi:polyprenyl synthetase family protein [Nocardioides aurantiacus]|uniref:Geranylgeranyl diphosphate synthase type I n=1 Tax=Nocardioides aurantiacus TaxID=86796 RepID=A0A3N2CXK0_9ACTN|nr:polyprenyl synthetase family protein [Nocardioides aurantiacus]ROR92251.1 geranylgeranyl diphosphate synthase type I [Nocardioides aurantiacus]
MNAALAPVPQPVHDAEASLQAVETLLHQRLAALREEWHAGAEARDTVLGDHDVPDLLSDLVVAGGKRFRPLLCHWGWVAVPEAAPGTHDDMVAVGAALELLHAFALAQDDVMDRSGTRRGRPAVHVLATERHRAAHGHDDAERYGDSIAVLAGDLGHAEADDLVGELPSDVRRLWRRTCVELVRGQARDLADAARGGDGDALRRALEVARAKSGAYTIQRPVELGATVAGADAATLEPLGDYGRHLGEAFALRDDLLGVWGSPEATGKPVGDDLRLGKSTVLLALAEQRLGGTGAAALRRVRRQTHDEADVVTLAEAMVADGVRDEVEEMVEQRVDRSLAALDHHRLSDEGVAGLAEVARRVAWRQR